MNHYLNAVRTFVDNMTASGREHSLIRYQIHDDVAKDPTLASHQVYGNRDDYPVIMLCADVNHVWERLPKKTIYLPTPAQLFAIKRQFGMVKTSFI